MSDGCCICLDELKAESNAIMPCCGKSIHQECIIEHVLFLYRTNKGSIECICPLCRTCYEIAHVIDIDNLCAYVCKSAATTNYECFKKLLSEKYVEKSFQVTINVPDDHDNIHESSGWKRMKNACKTCHFSLVLLGCSLAAFYVLAVATPR